MCADTAFLLERFDEALEYIDQHELYQPAINLYQARPEELKVCSVSSQSRRFSDLCPGDIHLIWRESVGKKAGL
jgi:hypothetical protein